MSLNELKISVIVPTFMREEILVETLNYLWAQDFPTSRYEVILVDQTPQHNSGVEEALTGMGERENFTWLRAKGWANLPAARNRGIEVANGDYVVFVDDDVVLDADFLQQVVRAFEESGADSVVGPVLMRPEKEPESVKDGVSQEGDEMGVLESRWVSAGRGCNMSFRRAIFQGDNPLWFDHRYLGNAILEETDVFTRLSAVGGRVWLDDRIPLIHLADRVGGCRAATFKDGKRLPKHFPLYFHNHFLYGVKQHGVSGLRAAFHQFRMLGESKSMKGIRVLFLGAAFFSGLFKLLVTFSKGEWDWEKISGKRFLVSKPT
ncbi:MAG: glycosyltransferase [Verrucomicrobiota bacterium JB023]|nr:glycosyltransferase [Verrucomicrobiota bacterium JB023]